MLPPPPPPPSYVLDRRICAFLRRRSPSSSHPSPPSPPVLPSYPSFRARTTIRSADVSPSRIASEKIGLAPASQLLGPAILQSRELVASSWHGLGRPRFRVNFIRGPVALHRVRAQVRRGVVLPVISQDSFVSENTTNLSFPFDIRKTKLVYTIVLFQLREIKQRKIESIKRA